MTQPSSVGRVIVATAANSDYFDFLLELIASIRAAENAPTVDIGCYDLGLEADELAQLAALNVVMVVPVTQLVAPQALKQLVNLGTMARPYLPDNFLATPPMFGVIPMPGSRVAKRCTIL